MIAPRTQRGAALLMAMLTVTLVATIASAAMWQQWRSVEVEQAERARVQSAWILTGALDWARLILREDAKGGGPDFLSEPWAVPLEEARLSTFLAAEKGVATVGDDSLDAFLSGQIVDLQSLLNVGNLVDRGKVSDAGLRSFGRLFALLGLPPAQLATLAENLRFASDASTANRSSPMAPLMPQQVDQLVWLGLSPETVAVLRPYVTVLAATTATPVNLNTASAEVIYAAIDGTSMADARRLVTERDRAPLRNLGDAARILGREASTMSNDQVGIASSFFESRGRLRLGTMVVEERSVLQRVGLNVTAIRRERGVIESPPPGTALPAR
ncbi:type II secretion system minor pseudopilin GspK [Caenimonas terrae]|uniref:Type II secretion system protein K n=1 Tax=Caenimonas terrae TaxID=696074 RepID=A0ABW0N9I2_9BURK